MKPTQASRCRIWSCACTSASVVSDPTYKRWRLPSMDCEWKRSSPRGKRFMRGLPRFTNGQEVNRLSLLAHAESWMGVFLDARNLCPKLSLTNKKELDPRLSDDMPERAMFYTMHHRRRPQPPRTANTRLCFHGAFRHTVWSTAEDEGSASSAPPPAGAKAPPSQKKNAPNKSDARARARCLT